MRDHLTTVFGPKACRVCGRTHYPGDCGPERPRHHNRHPWLQPGDHPDRVWMLVFDDADQRTMIWTHDEAEKEARAAYALYSPTWNCTLLATVAAAEL